MTNYLIVGLGNPGPDYEGTRHNVGFESLDIIQSELNAEKWKQEKKFKAATSSISGENCKLILLKPLTFMNLSGEAVQAAAKYLKIENNNIVVIYDDVDLATGDIRIRKQGGAGTHNGMKSIIQHMGNDFARIRIGIAPNHPINDLSNFVLGRFNKEEREKIMETLGKIPRILEDLMSTDIEKVMTKWNKG